MIDADRDNKIIGCNLAKQNTSNYSTTIITDPVVQIGVQSTVRKKMATGTFTYNALRAKTLKER